MILKRPLRLTATILTDNTYVLVAVNSATLECPRESHRDRNLSPHPCTIYQTTIPCGCDVLTNDTRLVRNRCIPRENETGTVLHSVNLALLQLFYQMTNNSLTGSNLFKPTELKPIQPIEFPFFAETNRLLSADSAPSRSLKKLSELLDNESVVYAPPLKQFCMTS